MAPRLDLRRCPRSPPPTAERAVRAPARGGGTQKFSRRTPAVGGRHGPASTLLGTLSTLARPPWLENASPLTYARRNTVYSISKIRRFSERAASPSRVRPLPRARFPGTRSGNRGRMDPCPGGFPEPAGPFGRAREPCFDPSEGGLEMGRSFHPIRLLTLLAPPGEGGRYSEVRSRPDLRIQPISVRL